MTEEQFKKECFPFDQEQVDFWLRQAVIADKVELRNMIREIEREKHEKHPTMVSEV